MVNKHDVVKSDISHLDLSEQTTVTSAVADYAKNAATTKSNRARMAASQQGGFREWKLHQQSTPKSKLDSPPEGPPQSSELDPFLMFYLKQEEFLRSMKHQQQQCHSQRVSMSSMSYVEDSNLAPLPPIVTDDDLIARQDDLMKREQDFIDLVRSVPADASKQTGSAVDGHGINPSSSVTAGGDSSNASNYCFFFIAALVALFLSLMLAGKLSQP